MLIVMLAYSIAAISIAIIKQDILFLLYLVPVCFSAGVSIAFCVMEKRERDRISLHLHGPDIEQQGNISPKSNSLLS